MGARLLQRTTSFLTASAIAFNESFAKRLCSLRAKGEPSLIRSLLWRREGENVIPNEVVIFVPLDREAFLAAFNMTRARVTVSKTKPGFWAIIVNQVDNAAGIERPEFEVSRAGSLRRR
jgi:hypothetical protein